MKQIDCAYESSVSRAVRARQWETSDASIKAHVAECASCREIFQTARRMQSLAQRPAGIAVLPEPGKIWWMAQLAERQGPKDRTRKLLERIQVLTALILAVALAGGFAWVWPRFQGQFADAINSFWPQWWGFSLSAAGALPGAYSGQVLLWVLLGVVGLSLFYPLLMEE